MCLKRVILAGMLTGAAVLGCAGTKGSDVWREKIDSKELRRMCKRIVTIFSVVVLVAGCGGMNLEFGGIRLQTGAAPDPMSRGVFGPQSEYVPVQVINPSAEYKSYETTTTVENVRPRKRIKAVLPPAATPCPTISPVTPSS